MSLFGNIFRATREMLGFIRRRHLPQILSFAFMNAAAIYIVVVQGDALFAVIVLSTANMFLVIMSSVGSGLLHDVLDSVRESLEAWKRDREFTRKLMMDHVDVMAELADHDPVVAERHRDKFAARLLEYNPDLEQELNDLRERADWN